MVRYKKQNLRGQWTEESLGNAVSAVQKKKLSVSAAAKRFGIPRRTLRRHVMEGKTVKSKLGRKSVLAPEQESELSRQVIRLAETGYPLTPKVLKVNVFSFCTKNKIENPFIKGAAGKDWLCGFLERNPRISARKAQALNPARAQKLNPFIVRDYFDKLKSVLLELDIIHKPQCIFNMDEKGIRLCLHKQPTVMAEKGAKRVHQVAQEHGENVTVVGCGNALGFVVLPVVLFKGKRMKQEWRDSLPSGAVAMMTQKGSMTTDTFVQWIHYFAQFKVAGPCLLIYDGAKCHLDYGIVDAAEQHDLTLLCLPSNTTHELQPMDKSVFGPLEHYWDEEVLKFMFHNKESNVTKMRFGSIFSPAWAKATVPANVKAGFAATGIYPYNPDIIPPEAFVPSIVTEILQAAFTPPVTLNNVSADIDAIPGTSGVNVGKKNQTRRRNDTSSSDSEDTDTSLQAEYVDSEEPINLDKEPTETKEQNDSFISFTELLETPRKLNRPRNTRPAINSRAVVLKKTLFSKMPKNKPQKKKQPPQQKKTQQKESWYCHICDEAKILDMRRCMKCSRYVHVECVGLSREDKESFLCPHCTI